jgi:hypothetical protein
MIREQTQGFAAGTSITQDNLWGTYVRARAMCADGKVRTVRVSEMPDTFFSIPAAVKVRGKTVSGYITTETLSGLSTPTSYDPAIVHFYAYTYGKNGHLLPNK